jgi:hypothetical protein
MNKYLQEIVNEMCRRINVDPFNIDFLKPDWYFEHTWTQEQAHDFIVWLTEYLYNNKEARKYITGINSKLSKKKLNSIASNFEAIYGWKHSN